MVGDNHNKKIREERSEIEKAHAALREETLPSLAAAYDKAGPATVLALTLILADVWLESGFSADDWREVILEIAPSQ
jgi:hypothetical protein